MSTIHGSPFANGILAYGKGKSIHDSPYPTSSKERTKWINGWWTAQARAKKAADAATVNAVNARPLDAWVAEEVGK